MLSRRQRTVVWAAVVLVAIWSLAMAGYLIAKNAKLTAEKVQAFAESVELSKLSPAERAKAIKALADKLNALSPAERRQARLDRVGMRWFEQMTEEEKATFIEATLPTGFKQMLAAFEQMPEERRRRAIDDALKNLRDTRERFQSGTPQATGQETNRGPELSQELQTKIKTIGLKAYYSQSSAQTKAELAPVLEELQRVMETGGRFRGR